MFLNQKINVGATMSHRKVEGTIALTVDGKPLSVDVSKVDEIVLEIGYWRKANHIHRWFVENCQEGRDEGQETYVSEQDLSKLRELCAVVLRDRAPEKLMPMSGFFFGSTEIDEWYWKQIEYTQKILVDLDPKGFFCYTASW